MTREALKKLHLAENRDHIFSHKEEKERGLCRGIWIWTLKACPHWAYSSSNSPPFQSSTASTYSATKEDQVFKQVNEVEILF